MKKLFTLFALALTLSLNVYSQAGDNDPTFNPSDLGFGLGDGANSNIGAIAIQSDGKIIIAGGFNVYSGSIRNNIARLNADGTLDGAFNPGTGTNTVISTTSIQSDGKIIIGGWFSSYNGTARNHIARLNSDGSLDGTFIVGTGANNNVFATALQSDGKIIIGGDFTSYNGTLRNRIARLNTDGTIDTTFKVGTGVNLALNSISIQSDGKIIIGGNFNYYNNKASNYLARINVDGSLDSTFTTGVGANNIISTTAIQSDGKIIIGGSFSTYNGTARSCIARLNTDGTLDGAFTIGAGVNGTGSTLNATAIQSDGKIIIGGYFSAYNGTARNFIARLNSNGTLDGTFVVGTGTDSYISVVAMQSNGKIIIGGAFKSYDGTTKNHIARLNTDGTLDGTFLLGSGANGIVSTIAFQNDGKIIIGGMFTSYNGIVKNYITRLNVDGSLDLTFNIGTGTNSAVSDISILNDGKIIIVGDFISYNGVVRNHIARLNTDGTLDVTFNPSGAGPNVGIGVMEVQNDGKIIIGGAFRTYNGTTKNRIARLNSDGTLDATFTVGTGAQGANPSFIYSVNTIKIQNDGKIIIGGDFITYNGTSRKCIARLNSDGTLDATFNPGTGASSTVSTAEIQSDGKIIIGGTFSSYNGTTINNIARLNSDGTLDGTYNTGLGTNLFVVRVSSIQSDGKVIVGDITEQQ